MMSLETSVSGMYTLTWMLTAAVWSAHHPRDPTDDAEACLAPPTPTHKPMKKKQKLIFVLCTTVVTFTLWFSISIASAPTPVPLPLRRTHHPHRIAHLLAEPVQGEHHMIFIETSCADPRYRQGEKGIVLHPRQACSIESAAKTNPKALIYLLYTCPIEYDAFEESRVFVRRMLTYPNVRVWRINVEEYFEGTPLELFYKTGAQLDTKWPKEHSSDVLRYLTLWKYGGTYIDLDVVVRRSFTDLGVNYAAAESDGLLASCVLNFGSDKVGREIAKHCLTELSTDFRGYDWGYNGPGLITRVMTRMCSVNVTSEMTPDRCSGFTIHVPSVFFPVMYEDWDLPLLFDEAQSDQTMRRLDKSHAVHIWNKMSHDMVVNVGSRQPYGLLADEFCPEVYQHCGRIF